MDEFFCFCPFFLFLTILVAVAIFITYILRRLKNIEETVASLKMEIHSSKLGPEEQLGKDEVTPARVIETETTIKVHEQVIEKTEDKPRKIEIPAQDKVDKPASEPKFNFETLLVGNILNKIGVIILIIGIGFFLKYAFDNYWISETVRILLGGIIGAGLLFGGSHFHKKELPVFAQGLVGAGISVLYLSVYAAYNFYHLISSPVSFVFMILITIISFHQALKYDSISVSILGLAGGFLTPLLLSSYTAELSGLLIYLAFLNIGVITVVFKKDKWQILELLSLITTFMFIVAISHRYVSEYTYMRLIFITVIWLIYTASDFSKTLRVIDKGGFQGYLSTILCACIYLSGVYSILNNTDRIYSGEIILLAAIIYVTLNVYLHKRNIISESFEKKTIIASIFYLFIATGFIFKGFTTVSVWSFELLAILWAGIYLKRSYIWKTSLLLYIIAALKLLFTSYAFGYSDLSKYIPMLNIRSLAYISLLISMYISSKLVNQLENNSKSAIRSVLRYCWCIILFIFLNVEVNDSFNKLTNNAYDMATEYTHTMINSILYLLYAIPLLRTGIKKNITPFTVCGSLVLIITIISTAFMGLYFKPIENFIPLINLRFGAFAVIIAGLGLIYLYLKDTEYESKSIILDMLKYSGTIILFILLSVEINDYFRNIIAITDNINTTSSLNYSKSLVFSLSWCFFSLPLIWLGLKRKLSPFLYTGLAVLIFALVLSLFFGFTYTPLDSFNLIINPRFMVLTILIVSLLFLQKLFKENIENKKALLNVLRVIKVIICGLIFMLITAEVLTFFDKQYYLTGYFIEKDLNLLSSQKQFILSAIWMVYSILLMIWGIFRRSRVIRITSILLFGITIMKLFLIDLSFLGNIYRIVSFIGLGVILLFASYLYQKYKNIIMESEES